MSLINQDEVHLSQQKSERERQIPRCAMRFGVCVSLPISLVFYVRCSRTNSFLFLLFDFTSIDRHKKETEEVSDRYGDKSPDFLFVFVSFFSRLLTID